MRVKNPYREPITVYLKTATGNPDSIRIQPQGEVTLVPGTTVARRSLSEHPKIIVKNDEASS